MNNEKKYIHYGHNVFSMDRFSPIKNRTCFNKPTGGLWCSDIDSDYGWKEWCEENEFRECDNTDSFTITLKEDTNILHIKSYLDVEKLPLKEDTLEMSFLLDIDFEKLLADGVDAIQIHISDDLYINYKKSLHYLLYGWDCDSILILNKNCIKSWENYKKEGETF